MELITIAKPYANAILQIAKENKTYQDWHTFLKIGADIASDKTMQAFIDVKKVTNNDKAKAVIALFKTILDRELTKEKKTFIGLLLKNKRFNTLPSILHLFERDFNKISKTKTFKVISAYELDTDEKQQITKILSSKYKVLVNIKTTVDKNLIGGVIIKDDDKVVDVSIKAMVDELQLCLSKIDSF